MLISSPSPRSAMVARMPPRRRAKPTIAGPVADPDTFGAQAIEHQRGEFRIVVGKRRPFIDDRRVDAEPVVGLGEFEAAASGAEDDEMGRLAR